MKFSLNDFGRGNCCLAKSQVSPFTALTSHISGNGTSFSCLLSLHAVSSQTLVFHLSEDPVSTFRLSGVTFCSVIQCQISDIELFLFMPSCPSHRIQHRASQNPVSCFRAASTLQPQEKPDTPLRGKACMSECMNSGPSVLVEGSVHCNLWEIAEPPNPLEECLNSWSHCGQTIERRFYIRCKSWEKFLAGLRTGTPKRNPGPSRVRLDQHPGAVLLRDAWGTELPPVMQAWTINVQRSGTGGPHWRRHASLQSGQGHTACVARCKPGSHRVCPVLGQLRT